LVVLPTMAPEGRQPSERARELGNRLKAARRKAGLRQEQVAEAIDSHPVTISKYERGIQDPSTELLGAMARLYGVSVDWLLGVEEEQPEEEEAYPGMKEDLRLLEQESQLALRMGSKGELSPYSIRQIASFIRWVREQKAQEEGNP
jgi:transcriptional regulator with XRE-family HTH domain